MSSVKLSLFAIVLVFSLGGVVQGRPKSVEEGGSVNVGQNPHLVGCKQPCFNRYGDAVCCDDVPANSDLTCPPMPRIIPDCSTVTMAVNTCDTDAECGSKERCCEDTCDPFLKICMPGERNMYYLMP